MTKITLDVTKICILAAYIYFIWANINKILGILIVEPSYCQNIQSVHYFQSKIR